MYFTRQEIYTKFKGKLVSKFTKLINTPNLFFRDFFDNRLKLAERKNASRKTNVDLVFSQIVDLSESRSFFYYCAESLESGEHHLNSWLPIFNEYVLTSKVNFVLILRNKQLFDWHIRNYPEVIAVYARRAVDVESILKAYPYIVLALYSSANISNGHLIRFNNIKHVFIGHGDSEKAGSAHKGLRWFDEIWTAGQAHIDRFKNLKDVNFQGLDFIKIGRPGVKKLLLDTREYLRPVYSDYSINILYLPTWEGVFEGHQYFSLPVSMKIIEIVINDLKCNLSVKFHPYTGGRNIEYKDYITNVNNNYLDNIHFQYISREKNIVEIIQNYDVFICDISSVVTECLSLNRPIFLYIPENTNLEMAASNMRYDEYCYIFSSLSDLHKKIEQVLLGNDYLKEMRAKAMDYFLGIEETKSDRMLDRINSIYEL